MKPLYAAVGGKPGHHPDGTYYLRYTDDGKPVFRAIGNDPQLAMIEKLKTERALSARAVGVMVEGIRTEGKRTPLTEAIEEYLLEIGAHKSKKTYDAYSLHSRCGSSFSRLRINMSRSSQATAPQCSHSSLTCGTTVMRPAPSRTARTFSGRSISIAE